MPRWLFALALAWLGPARGEQGLAIALHAQSKSEIHGWVAGSEITTRALREALLARRDVSACAVFAPFAYDGLDRKWDALLIEGYSGPATSVIRQVRRLNPNVVVAHWALDTYPSLAAVAALPVDAWVTNSRVVATGGFEAAARALELPPSGWFAEADRRPRSYVALAAPDDFAPANPTSVDPGLVVYLGQPSRTKRLLAPALRAIAEALRPPARLEIYGSAWDRFAGEDADYAALVSCCWRGKLETDGIAALYGRAAVVVGTTEAAQRRLGMVNNRVFEALVAAGRRFLAVEEATAADPTFAELRSIVGDAGAVVHSAAEAAAAVTAALRPGPRATEQRDADAHSYGQRAASVLTSLAAAQPSREVMVLVYDVADSSDWLEDRILPVLVRLDLFEIRLVEAAATRNGTTSWCAGAALVVAMSRWRGPVFEAVARLDASSACARGSGINGDPRAPAKALFLVEGGDGHFAPPSGCGDVLLAFDAVALDQEIPAAEPCLAAHPRAVDLGPDVTNARLEALLDAALFAPRAAAAVHILEPAPGQRLACSARDAVVACDLHVVVALRAFVPPDDGVWCARVDGTELSCQGDTQSDLNVQFLFAPSGPAPWTLTLTAVLRAGLAATLGDLPVVRTSSWVEVSAFLADPNASV